MVARQLPDDILLDVRDLSVSFRSDEGLLTAVDGITFQVHKGKTLGIVGESGSGKSVSTKTLMKLLPRTAQTGEQSQALFRKKDGRIVDLASLGIDSAAIRQIRGGEIGMIFQEPMASFSPVYTIGNQLMEAIQLHRAVRKKQAREIALDMLHRVGLSNPALRISQYPQELSGGMRQRAMIATALSTSPALLIADEPTTALDVTIQAQILELMRTLQNDLHMSIIFITHDMGVIAQVADEIAVLYLGRIVERGPTASLIANPKHPYTQGLLAAMPRLDRLDRRLQPIGGDIPSPLSRPRGCPFHTRCPSRQPGVCDVIMPTETAVGPAHWVSCVRYA